MQDSPAVTVLVMVETGSKYETKETNGISHFLEHMVFKGTEKRPTSLDISKELDSLGAHANAFTGQEYTGYYAKVTKEHAYTALDIVSDVFLNPLFNPKEIEKEKGVIIEELRMYKDMPRQHVHDVFGELLYGDQPAGWNVIGTEDTIKSFSRKHFIDYQKEHYVGKATTIVVAGSFDENDMKTKVAEIFSKIPATEKSQKLPVKESQDEPKVKIEYKETDQTHLVLGVRAPSSRSKDAPTFRVLSAILGGGMSSRLFQKLREEMGVCYYVGSDYDGSTDHGSFIVSAGVDSKRVQEVINVLLEEIKKISTEPIPAAELAMAKDYLIGNTLLALETSDAVAHFCAVQQIVRGEIKTPDQLANDLKKVTAEDISRVAKEIFVTKHLNLAMIGKFKDEGEFKGILKF